MAKALLDYVGKICAHDHSMCLEQKLLCFIHIHVALAVLELFDVQGSLQRSLSPGEWLPLKSGP